MSLLDQYRNNVERKARELSQLQTRKATEHGKIPSITNKINSAIQAASKTTSASTRTLRMNDVERYRREYAAVEKKIADIEKEIGRKQKELFEEQKKVSQEEQVLQKKRADEQLRQSRNHAQQMDDIMGELNRHASLHRRTISKLDALQRLPEHIIVLYLASNPLDATQLRLDEEARSIQETIQKSKHRDAVQLQTRWAVRPMDIFQAINELEPTIIHFSGHGSDNDEIIFQRDDGSAHAVKKEAIISTIAASSDKVRLVFFNSCYSHAQAREVIQHVEAAIGIKTSIGDESARIFAAQFYSSIGFGLSLQKAFEQAKAAMMLMQTEEHDTPELFVRENLDAAQLFLVSKEAANTSVGSRTSHGYDVDSLFQ